VSPASASPLLDEKILAIHTALTAARIPHAFGGALAQAYYATPRATIDIDLNVFVPVEEAERVLAVLLPLGVAPAAPRERAALHRQGQLRVFWEHTPLDLFFAYDPLHDRCRERARRVPFGPGAEIPILSAEDLVIFKVLFDRPKDRRDIDEILFSLGAEFDTTYVRAWLARILPEDDARLRRFEALST